LQSEILEHGSAFAVQRSPFGGAEWHLGEIASCHATLDEAISVAKELKDTHALALALDWAARQAFNERNPAEVDRLAIDAAGFAPE